MAGRSRDNGITKALAAHPSYRYATRDGKESFGRAFGSIQEFADVAKEIGNLPASTIRDGEGSEWSGGGFSQAVAMAEGKGWDTFHYVHTFPLGDESLAMIESPQDSFVYEYDVSGSVVDVAAWLTGEPENMIDAYPVTLPAPNRVVRIVVPFGYRAEVDQELARQRGTAVIGLIDAMTRAGYSLEVWGVSAQQSYRSQATVTRRAYAVKIHGAGTMYDPKMIAFGTGHPLMHRKLRFAVSEHENDQTWKQHGYGGSVEPDINDLPEGSREGATIVLPLLTGSRQNQFATLEGVEAWINKQVKAITSGELTQGVN